MPPQWMLRAHYEENAPLKHALELDPDWSRYLEAQARNELLYVVAHNLGGSPPAGMVGYMAMFLHPHPHYRGVTIAYDDAHYLVPELRGMGNGKAMIDFAEKAAYARGARVFAMRTKAAQSHGALFEKLGYTLTDLVYLKELTDG